ncbi:MAG: sialidase family protein [Rhodospirillaceae bacterium]
MNKITLGLVIAVSAVLGWIVYTGIAKESSIGGVSLGAVVDVGTPDANSSDPFLNTTIDGRVLLSWTEKPNPDEQGRNAFLAQLDGQGNPVSPRRINDIEGHVHWYGGDNRLKFSAAADGTITALWQAPMAKEFKISNVYFASATSDGAFAASSVLNDDDNDPPVAHAFSTVETAPNGKVYATWIDGRNRTFEGMGEIKSTEERRADIKMRDLTIPEHAMKSGPRVQRSFAEPNSQLFMAVSEDGGKTFGENYPITDIQVCACCVPNIAFLDGGDTVIVSYRNVTDESLRDNVIMRSADGGKTFSEPQYFSQDGWIARFCPHAGPSMISDGEGNLHISWFTPGTAERGDEGIYYAMSKDGGLTWTDRERLAETPSHTVLHAEITSDATGRLWVVWENFAEGEMKPRIYMAHRGPNDSAWSETIEVGTGNAVTSMLPMIASTGNGVYVSWIEKNGEDSQVKVRTATIPVS